MRRVAITGGGTINSLGSDVPSTLEAMREGRCGIGPLEIRDAERLSVQIGGQVKNYDENSHFNRQQIALGQELHLLGHAIGTAQIAAISD